MTNSYHLAQANIAHMRAPLEDPIMEGFVSRLDPLNALADASPGFVWRLDSEEGDATAYRLFENTNIIFNMTVWESYQALKAYVYEADHVGAVQRRAEWFERPTRSPFVLWWIDAGHIPTVEDAKERLELLWERGPTAEAFTFRHRFEPGDILEAQRENAG